MSSQAGGKKNGASSEEDNAFVKQTPGTGRETPQRTRQLQKVTAQRLQLIKFVNDVLYIIRFFW